MDYSESIKFLNKINTPALKEKYHIRVIEETTLGRRDGILVPVFTVYIRTVPDESEAAEINEIIGTAYKEHFNANVLPLIEIRSSARYAREYKGNYYHMCLAYDSPDRDFPDFEIYEVSKEGYDAILDMKQAGFKSQYDEKLLDMLMDKR